MALQKARRNLKSANRTKRIDLQLLNGGVAPESSELSDSSETSSAQKVNSALSGLSILQFEVITALFPAHGAPLDHKSIAEKFGLPLDKILEIEAEALRSLRGGRRGLKGAGAPWN